MLQFDKEGPMLGLVELLIQMWVRRGGGVHPDDKPIDFGGAKQDSNLSGEMTYRQLNDRIKITTLGGPMR